jgi:hypothetical protein
MIDHEQAQFALSLLSAINGVLVAAFLLGILTGAFFFSRLFEFVERLIDRHEAKKTNKGF